MKFWPWNGIAPCMGTEWEVAGKGTVLWDTAQEPMALLEGGSPWCAWPAHHRDFSDYLCWVLVKPCLKQFWIPLIKTERAKLESVQWRDDKKVIEERLKALDLADRKEALK